MLFRYLLDFKKAALAKLRDKRKSMRYPVAATFPLRASITLQDSDQMGRKADSEGRLWGGSVINMSIGGLSVQLPPAAVSRRGHETMLVLSLDGYQLMMPAVVAHFRVQSASAICGLELKVKDLDHRKGYLQVLETVILGSTLELVEKPTRAAERAGFAVTQFKSSRKATLTAWREPETKKLAGFELLVNEHCVRGEANRPALEIFSSNAEGERRAWSAPGFAVSEGIENPEVRQLYRWVALNLPKAVPADLREMMRFFANARTDWKAPPGKGRRDSTPTTAG